MQTVFQAFGLNAPPTARSDRTCLSEAVTFPVVPDQVTFSGKRGATKTKGGSTLSLAVWQPPRKLVLPPGLQLKKDPMRYKDDILALWGDAFTDGSPEALEKLEGDFNAFIRKKCIFCILTNADDQAVAVGVVDPRINDYAEISDIVVAPSARRTGAGEAVTRYLINQSKAFFNLNQPGHRVTAVKLQVDRDNHAARSLYKKLGFYEIRCGKNKVFMCLDLERWNG